MKIQEIKDLFGRNIKYYRFHRHLSQTALAEKANISVTFLSNIERGKMFPKVETLSRLTESLNVSVHELFKMDHVPDDQREMINRLTIDIKGTVITALDGVFKQYLG
ncbi:MAG: helix-turn-helix domain-containing protein [Treponema sp.]|jgi:transcriptional regulator with XRE-family HTH domain|nr:helix-turn-helix domain-containing protein [Treponema sp.]